MGSTFADLYSSPLNSEVEVKKISAIILFLIDNTENTQEIHKWDSDDACAHS
jgi:hypothetical protein